MSHAGINIRKIRTLKGLSQSELAKQLKIGRASIGSYEEGRAEPKLETLLKIANIFSLSVEQLVEAELKMNDLIGFTPHSDDSDRPAKAGKTHRIPLFHFNDPFDFDGANFSGFRKNISLPLNTISFLAAFITHDFSMRKPTAGPVPGDILVCELTESPSLGIPLIVAKKEEWFFGRASSLTSKSVTLKFDNRNFPDQEIAITDNASMWKLTGLFSSSLLI